MSNRLYQRKFVVVVVSVFVFVVVDVGTVVVPNPVVSVCVRCAPPIAMAVVFVSFDVGGGDDVYSVH